MLEIGSERQSSFQLPVSNFCRVIAPSLVFIATLGWMPIAEAAIVRGIQEVLAGVLQIPLSTIAGTFNGPPIIGTLFGALSGAVKGVGLVAHGALELAASGVSLAKTIGPYLIPFLL